MAVRILRAASAPWGDYGDILMHGMTAHLHRTEDGRLQLERVGPFMPPITFPGIGDIVVTDAFRVALQHSALTPLSFRPVHKARIVKLSWDAWDRDAALPPSVPASGEPEDYILKRRHSAAAAQALGDVWEVVLPVAARVERSPGREVSLLLDTWGGDDLFRAEGVLYNYASPKAQEWLAEHASEFIMFQDCALKGGAAQQGVEADEA